MRDYLSTNGNVNQNYSKDGSGKSSINNLEDLLKQSLLTGSSSTDTGTTSSTTDTTTTSTTSDTVSFDFDGDVDWADYNTLDSYLNGDSLLDDTSLKAADVTGDGYVTDDDLSEIETLLTSYDFTGDGVINGDDADAVQTFLGSSYEIA